MPFAAALTALAGWLWAAMSSRVFWLLAIVVLKDFVFSIIADLLGMAVNAVNATGFDLPTLDESMSILPMDVLKIMKRIGVDDCLALIVTAYTVRASIGLIGVVKSLKPRL